MQQARLNDAEAAKQQMVCFITSTATQLPSTASGYQLAQEGGGTEQRPRLLLPLELHWSFTGVSYTGASSLELLPLELD